jgi:hypothetical protein
MSKPPQEVLLYWEENDVKERWKAKSRQACADAIGAFAECGKGRTISVVWACSDLKKEMMGCLKKAWVSRFCPSLPTNRDETFQFKQGISRILRRDATGIYAGTGS